MDINLIEILRTFGTMLSGIGIGWLSKSGRMKEKADAYKKMGEAYQYRIDSLHDDIKVCNTTIKELQERIAELNRALDDKTEVIRRYVADIMKAEAEVNRVNDKLVEAQQVIAEKEREIAELRVALEYALEWRCEHPDCADPRGRRPPNGKLCGQTFCMPAIVEKYRQKAKAIMNINKEQTYADITEREQGQ